MIKIFFQQLAGYVHDRRVLSKYMGSSDSNGLKTVMRDFDLAYAGGTVKGEEVSSVRLEGVGSGSRFSRINESLGRVGFELRCLNSSYGYWGICAVKKT